MERWVNGVCLYVRYRYITVQRKERNVNRGHGNGMEGMENGNNVFTTIMRHMSSKCTNHNTILVRVEKK